MHEVKLALIDAAAPAVAARLATPLANSPLIGHVLDELARAGLEEVRIVVAEGASKALERAIASRPPGGPRVVTVAARGGGRAVVEELSRALQRGPALIHPGDCLLGEGVAQICERFAAGDVDAVLPARPERELKDTGRLGDAAMVLAPAAGDCCRAVMAGAGRRSLARAILSSGLRLAVCEQPCAWCYCESTEALLEANRMLLDALPGEAGAQGAERDGVTVAGRVAIHPSAQLRDCAVCGPVAIGARARVEDSHIGPYTAIGADAVVIGSEVDNSMVLEGAELRHPGMRIEGSILGERASVTRSFQLPRGLHLHLPPGSRVTLS